MKPIPNKSGEGLPLRKEYQLFSSRTRYAHNVLREICGNANLLSLVVNKTLENPEYPRSFNVRDLSFRELRRYNTFMSNSLGCVCHRLTELEKINHFYTTEKTASDFTLDNVEPILRAYYFEMRRDEEKGKEKR